MSVNQRIAVVGAGAAGLSAAHYLRAKGYTNVEVLEASSRAGGKCCSYHHNGQAYDVGAIFVTQGYENILRFAEHYNVPLVEGPAHRIYYPDSGKNRWIVPEVDELLQPSMLLSSLRWANLFAGCRRLARAGFLDMPDDTHLPISEFFHRHRVDHFQRLAVPVFTSFGYGYPDTIPAAYLLKFSYLGVPGDLQTFLRGVRVAWKRQAHGSRGSYIKWWRVDGGYESLMQTMAKELPVKLNTPVTSVERCNGQVSLRCGDELQKYDKVIFTIDPLVLAKVLGKDDPVATLMEQTEAVDFHSIVCEVQNVSSRCVRIFSHNLTPDRGGHLTTYCQPEPPDNICVAYGMGDPNTSNEDMEEKIGRDFAAAGAQLVKVLQHNRWRYAPHVRSEQMRSFFPAVEARQGSNGIFFGGEIMSFGTVENVCEYSRSLVERFF